MRRSRLATAWLLALLSCSRPPLPHAVLDAAVEVQTHTLVFPVGSMQRTWVDGARPTPEHDGQPALPQRTLAAQVWYPAVLQGPDSTADLSHGPYPLVLFVHGSSSTAAIHGQLLSRVAAAGYVVVAADFPLTSLLTDGGPSDLHVQDQQQDLMFLADRLLTEAGDGVLQGLVDRAAGYSVVGHSTGGTVALLAAYRPDLHDERLRAVVDLAGDACFFAEAFFASRPVPLLAIGGTNDPLVPLQANVVRAWQLAKSPAALVILRGGTHLQFTDLAVEDPTDVSPTTPAEPLAQTLQTWGGGSACVPIAPPGTEPLLPHEQQLDLTAAWIAAFLTAHVRHQPMALQTLEKTQDPRVQVQSK